MTTLRTLILENCTASSRRYVENVLVAAANGNMTNLTNLVVKGSMPSSMVLPLRLSVRQIRRTRPNFVASLFPERFVEELIFVSVCEAHGLSHETSPVRIFLSLSRTTRY